MHGTVSEFTYPYRHERINLKQPNGHYPVSKFETRKWELEKRNWKFETPE